jgi:hypothetical protein
MIELKPETARTLNNVWWHKLIDVLLMLFMSTILLSTTYFVWSLGTDIGLTHIDRGPFYVASISITLVCLVSCLVKYNQLKDITAKKNEGETHVELKRATDEQLLAFNKWAEIFPSLREFGHQCVKQNSFITEIDYLRAKHEVKMALRL